MAALIIQQIINDNLRVERRLQRPNHLQLFTDDELHSRYRFGREELYILEALVHDDLQHRTKRSHALEPMEQLLLALRFYACGSFQMVCYWLNLPMYSF